MTSDPAGTGAALRAAPTAQDFDSVLLCAGIGKRLRPLTDQLPKALVPVAGRPIVDHHLHAWRAAGVRHAILVTGYREEQLRAHVGNGERYGIDVSYVSQPELRGSGDALLLAASRVRQPHVLVGYCDVFFEDSRAIWTALLDDRQAKIVGARVEDASSYGRLVTDDAAPWRRLVGIREKDGQPTPGLVNAGAYLIPRRVIEILSSVGASPRGEIELTDAVTDFVREGGQVRVVPTSAWIDVGTPEHLAQANEMAKSAAERAKR
jgi:UDP-N-acetylglucosamine diphosphorylase / glucose-1-phosphate thymidylyltransferase / UDP-N-acetylgalactosamine diphosphorylase / glucosamine-1-phosphate N-acetyltransferase / galactosamine-1-phosphate N-acetyltransferase